MISDPDGYGADAIYTFHILAACASLVVARYTTGGIHAYALAFRIFGIVTPFMNACPDSLEWWLYENVTHDGPETLPVGNGWEFGPHRIISTWFDLLVAMFAGSLTSSIVRGFTPSNAVDSSGKLGEP